MPAHLKYVDPHRPPSVFSRAYARFSATRLGRFLSANIAWKVDPYLLRATRGRVGSGLVIPTALLETRGAKSGAARCNAVIYFHDADRVTIVASKAGHKAHPAWFHNLRAHPDVTFGGIPMRATVVSDEAERQRLWTLADGVFAPYATYRRRRRRRTGQSRSSSSPLSGEGGIRTHEAAQHRPHDFQSCTLSHSVTSPSGLQRS